MSRGFIQILTALTLFPSTLPYKDKKEILSLFKFSCYFYGWDIPIFCSFTNIDKVVFAFTPKKFSYAEYYRCCNKLLLHVLLLQFRKISNLFIHWDYRNHIINITFTSSFLFKYCLCKSLLSSTFLCLLYRIIITYIEYTNVSVYYTTIYFLYIKIVYCQGDMFRPSLGHLQALKKHIQDYIDFFMKTHCGIPNAHKMCYKSSIGIVDYMCL